MGAFSNKLEAAAAKVTSVLANSYADTYKRLSSDSRLTAEQRNELREKSYDYSEMSKDYKERAREKWNDWE